MPLPKNLPLHTVTLRVEQMREAGIQLLLAPKLGVAEKYARIVTEELVKAEIAGYPSHGFSRFSRYVGYILDGYIDPKAKIEVTPTQKNGGAIVDGNWHFGQVIMHQVVEVALEGMNENAIFNVVARKSNHIGRLASYLEIAAREGYIARAEANSVGQPKVVHHGSREARIGTEPHGVALPCGDDPPFIYDASTAVIVEGNCNVLRMAQLPLPSQMLLDGEGRPTNDPTVLYLDKNNRGGILPLGLLEQGYRGSGHAIMISGATGILSQTGFGQTGRGVNGVSFQLTDVAAFLDYRQYIEELKTFLRYLKNAKRADEDVPILLSGEGARKRAAQAVVQGVQIPYVVWKEVKKTAQKVGVSLDDIAPIAESDESVR